jgi:protein required for attachment to host cells
VKLQHGTWVVVADGEKFLLLRNNMDTEFTDLRVIGKDEIDNPPAHAQSSDRAGRMRDNGPGGKSALQQTDWHEAEKERFAQKLAERLEAWAAEGRYSAIVVIADPRSLGDMRAAYGNKLKSRLVAEISKDLTNMPVDEIEIVLNAI